MTPPLPTPRAILFDWDNTLVDSWPVIQDALNATFRAYGLPEWSLDEVRTRVRKSMRDSFPALFGDAWEEAGDLFFARYGEIHAERIGSLPGAQEMLRGLANSGVYLAVVSNKKGDILRREARGLGWDGYFTRLVGAFDAPRDKPDRAPVDLALGPSGVVAGPDVWFVGDADIDMQCAGVAGCTPILLRAAAPKTGEFDEFPPHRHFRACQELCKFVLNM